MSLINQMLKDLEKRKAQSLTPEITLSGLIASDAIGIKRSRSPMILLTLLLCATVGALFFVYKKEFTKKVTHTVYQPQATVAVTPDVDSVVATPAVPENAVAKAAAILTGLTLQHQQETTYLRFILNQSTLYSVALDAKRNKLIITLDHTNVVADLPTINYVQSAINGMEMSENKEGDLQISLALNNQTEIKSLTLSDGADGTPELQLDILNKDTNTLAQNNLAADIKRPVEEFNIEQQYKDALNYAASGDKAKSMELLSHVVAKYPEYSAARESLVTMLLKAGNFASAKKVLQAGLNMDANNLAFVELQAHMLLNSGNINAALTTLQKLSPGIDSHPDYYAFMAALYQQKGDAMLAEKMYQKLVSIHPDQGAWWTGLAIALESQGNASEAKEAYLRANQVANISPELSAFIQTKINSI